MPRSFKSRGTFGYGRARRTAYAKSRSSALRTRLTASQRGYQRTSGYYGRFRRRPSAAGNELKFLDTPSTTTYSATTTLTPLLADATGVLTTWDVIPEGTGPSERVGRKCTIKQIFVKGQCRLTGSSVLADTSDKVRIVMVLDKQHNGSASEATGSLILEGDSVNSFRNLEETGRFKVLADKVITLSKAAGSTTGGFGSVTKAWNISLPKVSIPLEYSGSTGGTTELRSNHISLFTVSELTGQTAIDCNMRLRYADN